MNELKQDMAANTGEDEVMQQYPSPSANGQDTGAYYHASTRDVDPGPQPPTPQRPPNLEELQLAAQLGQVAVEQELPSADHVLASAEDPSLQHILPDPDSHSETPDQVDHSAAHHFLAEPAQPDGLPHPMPIPLEHTIVHQYHMGDSTPPRKRSKVSRACDECRRKKVKCDAQTDSGDTPCSNCKRSSLSCLFSRIPQKRGPSKGYIKELADRINSIEGKLDIQGAEDPTSRKRPFSSITGELSTPATKWPVTWGSEPRPIQPVATPTDRIRASYSSNSLAPQPLAMKPDQTPSRLPGAPFDSGISDVTVTDNPGEIDDATFELYMVIIHPSLPFLPSNKPKLQAELIACPTQLQRAFTEAFYSCITSFAGGDQMGDCRLAHKLLFEWRAGPGRPRSIAQQILYLQTLILLALESDNQPFSESGPDAAHFIGTAITAANSSRLYHARYEPKADGEEEVDSDDQLRVRLWWTLVVLDRWSAVGTGSRLLISEDTVVYNPRLKLTLGEAQWHLMRFVRFLGRASAVISELQSPNGLESALQRKYAPWIEIYIEQFREDLPEHIDPTMYPIVHLAYWHCRLLAYLLQPSARTADIMWPARESAKLLIGNMHLTSPFHHHFLVLTCACLGELSRIEGTREEAVELLNELSDPSMPETVWDGLVRAKVAEMRPSVTAAATTISQEQQTELAPGQNQSQPSAAAATAASQGLQHLADLATAATGNDDGAGPRTAPDYQDMGFDPRPLLAEGYLNSVRPSSTDF